MKRYSILLVLMALIAAGCGESDADKASKNISTEAEQFKVLRKFVVVNGITDKVEFEVTGRCSYESTARQLVLTCKEVDKPGSDKDEFKKHTIGLSDNTIWTQTQLATINVSVFRTKVIFKPESIIPDVDLVTSGSDQTPQPQTTATPSPTP